MVRAKYNHNIKEYKGTSVIVIEDLNGLKTVTNDIENVVEEIAQVEGLNPVEHIIVYRDSEGNWDGYNFSTQLFEVVTANSWQGAVEHMLTK